MTIINPLDTTITINYFNRLDITPYVVSFYNESNRITENKLVVTSELEKYYNVITISNSDYFKEGNSYVMAIKDDKGNELFIDKCYATSQDVEDNKHYTINNDVYTTNDTDNEYTIYE